MTSAFPAEEFVFPFFDNFTTQEVTNFSTNSYNESFQEANRFILPVWRQVLWTILYGSMVIVATGGNLIVIWIVLAHKRMRTVTNYFLLNLSIADTMASTLNVTFNYVYMLNSHWPFGELYCKITQFIAMLSICASVFSLMSISIDRYMAIMKPLRPRMGRTVTLLLAMSTWVVGFIIGLPSWLFYKTYHFSISETEERIICFSEWPDGVTNESMIEYSYNVAFLFVTYVVPIGSMTFTYARIGKELWGSQSIGECTQRQMENIKSKRRVVKMMMVVVIIFAVCWLPYHLYFIVTSYFPDITNTRYIQETYLAIYWLAMSNSMYNPMIYCWMNARFRRGFKQFFSCLPCVHVAPAALTRREVLTGRKRSCSGSPDHNRITRNGTLRITFMTSRPSPTASTNTYYSNVHDETTQIHRGGFESKRKWSGIEMKQFPAS
ncbi:tachykinin-like peptides receptor 99D [Coccinella septempunctata]|uniref:tachykinin-like peptides receptor 99D n=1 Tax=Coccinella septempunctata TaxID=41139 RepID=UPI001D065D61|nr:tachykinin-like peptides receptor 99D [Coccinella septempunctata]XP_044762536.1 tachykinin-like peptides receptor 99D [Coccinella septempunctata]